MLTTTLQLRPDRPGVRSRARTDSRSVGVGFALVLALSSCGGGGSSGGDAEARFELLEIGVREGAVWEVNRAIVLRFSDELDFGTVSLNTVQLTSEEGVPAVGTFAFQGVDLDGDGTLESVDRRRVVFQPACPRAPDLSDSGLLSGTTYRLDVLGRSAGADNVLTSSAGVPLGTSQSRRFSTPESGRLDERFQDPVLGPPLVVVRRKGATDAAASYVELGGDDARRSYFERDPLDGSVAVEGGSGFRLPLNLFSTPSSHVAFVLEWNQPVSPAPENFGPERLRIERAEGAGWVPVATRAELVANCTVEGGARVRLEPVGVLPRGSTLRVVVDSGFEDLVGDATRVPATDFAVLATEAPTFEGLEPADDLADALREDFDLGAEDPASFEDEAPFATARAIWSDGRLRAAFDFTGTGGNEDGDFDWVVGDPNWRAGDPETFVLFDTTETFIRGGPGGVITEEQRVLGGEVDVRDFLLLEGAVVRIQGPNPFVLRASGRVEIRGRLDASGFSARDVVTLRTGNLPESGGAGVAGGGRGGGASTVTNDSTRQGETGEGAFGLRTAGGAGGESGYFVGTAEQRRPGNGGGGAFGRYPGGPKRIAAEAGFDGAPETSGCRTNRSPAAGGFAGPDPFVSEDLLDDVFGVRPVVDGAGELVALRQGELRGLWAGAGGGGGGDALRSNSCPTPGWTPASDEKGGGGGGGGGAIRIRALGPIVFGHAGTVLSEGGQGATGENTSGFNHIGGSGGGGSGGHVLLESASGIDFTDGRPETAPVRAYVSVQGGLGGQGVVEPIDSGGAGGAGIVQLHVPDPLALPGTEAGASIRVPAAALGDPLAGISLPAAVPMVPTFSARSSARSRWIDLGTPAQRADGTSSALRFVFDGIETEPGSSAGQVRSSGGEVPDLAPLLTFDPGDPGSARLESDGRTLTLLEPVLRTWIEAGGARSPDLYLRTPGLLRSFALQVEGAGAEGVAVFDVSAATADRARTTLSLTVSSAVGGIAERIQQAAGGPLEARLIPRFFRVLGGGLPDRVPEGMALRITFDAAQADAQGRPDEGALLAEDLADLEALDGLEPGRLRFLRFRVEFDLDAGGQGLEAGAPELALDHLSLPFRF